VKGAVGTVRNKNFEISLIYNLFDNVIPRLNICIKLKLHRRIITASHNCFFILGYLKQHVSAQQEAINRQMKYKRNYYVSFITIFHIIRIHFLVSNLPKKIINISKPKSVA